MSAREEQAGHVRYLRPIYQASCQQKASLVLPTAATTASARTCGPPN